LVSVDARGAEAAADWNSLRSPETYVGYERSARFASPDSDVLERPYVFAVPPRLRLNEWALGGGWTVKQQSIELNQANGRIVFRFHARDVHLVMGPTVRGTPVRFRVLIDKEPPGAAHGEDIADGGWGTVDEPRMYQLIRQRAPVVDRQFEIEFFDAGIEAFVFTFG
jgi:hypothetical protein